jgi:hypothetical protein
MRFFVLDSVVGSTHETDSLDLAPVHVGEVPLCPVCGEIAAMLPWLPPYRATVRAFGRALGDVAFASGSSLLVSDRFRRAWEEAGLRGISEFTPLERIRIRPPRLANSKMSYFHIALKLWGTQVDLDRSLIEYDRPVTCHKCKSGDADGVRGFSIDEASWTGEDIFYPWGLSGIRVVTDRVRQLRDDHGLTNVNLTPTEEYFWDPYNKWSTPIWHGKLLRAASRLPQG